jgi:calcineurin-like phosphoesterase family protein
MTIWFSSDHHFHHANIIKYADRPFADPAEMNHFIVKQHNAYVQPSDHWYCLGDVTMERDNQGRGLHILDGMHGHKRLIMGNHDHYHVKHYLKYFEKVMAMQRMDDLWFMHVPCHPSNVGRCSGIVHGHIHQNPSPPPAVSNWVDKDTGAAMRRIVPYLNISLEATGYRPLSLDEIREKVKELRENYRDS